MSKATSAGMVTHLALETTSLAGCVEIVRQDAQAFYFTELDADLVIDGNTYKAGGSFRRTNIRARSTLQSDGLDLEGIIDSADIAEADLRAGLFDSASVRFFLVNHQDLSLGKILLKKGTLGAIEFGEGGYKVQFRDLADALQTTTGDLIGVTCLVDLGSTKCGERLNPPTWAATTAYTVREARDAKTGSVVKPTSQNGFHFKCTFAGTSGGAEPAWPTTLGATIVDGGVTWQAITARQIIGTVTSVTDRRNFFDSSLIQPDDHFSRGLVTWTAGANNGLVMDVEKFGQVAGSPSSGEVRLMLPMPNDISVGDTFTITAGCNNDLIDFRDKFDNVENIRATGLYLPGIDEILRFPDAK